MIRALVDFALKNRWLVLGGTLVLLAWGVISFRNLPIEAYPDVANNYVQIITQWPGRSAEEIERQVTVPVEIQMAGIPHLTHLRSTTLAGLSSLMLVFDDDSTSDVNREHVLERLSQVNLPANLVPQMGTDWSPVGQIYWYTIESTNPSYDVMEKKSLEDWFLEKSFKGVQGVVDVSSFGGPTKEYQIKLDPEKLVSYGLTPTAAAASSSRARSRSTCSRWVSSPQSRTSRTPSSKPRTARLSKSRTSPPSRKAPRFVSAR
jgi:cobalt-zinc-cadmium resistance protein CzcA